MYTTDELCYVMNHFDEKGLYIVLQFPDITYIGLLIFIKVICRRYLLGFIAQEFIP